MSQSLKIRNILEEETQMELKEYRSFIDEEMITILGQMDSASKIFDHVYLVSKYQILIYLVIDKSEDICHHNTFLFV